MTPDGLTFGLYAPDATMVDLLLFDRPDATTPRQTVPMRRDGDIWRIGIRGDAARSGLHYLFQVAGPVSSLRRIATATCSTRITDLATRTPT